MKQQNNFTQGRIFTPLIQFALPVLLALILQAVYGAVDLLVVGQFGTAADVSAGVGVAEKLCAFVMLQGLIGAFGVRIPVSWLMSRRAEISLFHIGLATPASTMVQIILCGVYFLLILRRRQSRQSLGR